MRSRDFPSRWWHWAIIVLAAFVLIAVVQNIVAKVVEDNTRTTGTAYSTQPPRHPGCHSRRANRDGSVGTRTDCQGVSQLRVNGGSQYTLGLNLPPGEKGERRVVAQSGCLACHKIGDSGNGSLGPNLTHIGSRASRASILATLKAGPGIMPSFQNLGKERLDAAVDYLANLK